MATTKATNTIAKFSASAGSISSGSSNFISSGSSTSIGINASGIAKIKDSINNYVVRVNKVVSTSNSDFNKIISSGVKGSSSVNSLKTMNSAINTKVQNLINSLKKYSNQLDTILSNYKKYDSSNTNFTNLTKQVKSSNSGTAKK